ncbi:MAG: NAD-binding protein [Actinomycetota bacterium]
MYIIVCGCGRVGAQLATMLSNEGHDVVVIDSSADSFRRLGSGFNGLTIVGNGFDERVLEKAGIEKADVFAAVTNLDNTNIMAGQVAKKLYDVPKVISRVYYPDREKTYHRLGLETICGTTLVAKRVRDRILGHDLAVEESLNQKTRFTEMKATPALVGKKVAEIEIPNQFRLVEIIRNNEAIIVSSDTKIALGDTIIAVVSIEATEKIRALYNVDIFMKVGDLVSLSIED